MDQKAFNDAVVEALASIPYMVAHGSHNDRGFSHFHATLKQLKEHQAAADGRFVRIDNEPYDWPHLTISGDQVKKLVGAPDNAKVFLKVRYSPDRDVTGYESIELGKDILEFSTQAGESVACHEVATPGTNAGEKQ